METFQRISGFFSSIRNSNLLTKLMNYEEHVKWILGSGPFDETSAAFIARRRATQDGPLELEHDGYADQEAEPILAAMSTINQCVENMYDDNNYGLYDQQSNLREMAEYLTLVGSGVELESEEKRKKHLMSCILMLSSFKHVMTRVGVFLSRTDGYLFDIYGIFSLFYAGNTKLTIVALILFLCNIVVGIIRISFIGKEAYNLRKMLVLGHLSDASSVRYEPYRHECIIQIGRSAQSQETVPKEIVHRVKTLMRHLVEIIRSRLVNRGGGSGLALESDPEIPLTGIPSTSTAETILEEKKLILQKLIPDIGWNYKTALAPSVTLNNSLLKWASSMNARLRHEGAFVSENAVLEIIYEAAALQFLKFQTAEMAKTELMMENIPQFVLQNVPLINSILTVGYVGAFSNLGLRSTISLILSVLGLANTMFGSSLDQIGFYFVVYKHGQDFQPEPAILMPEYGILRTAVGVIAHVLTLSCLMAVTALSCTSVTLTAFPVILLIGGMTIIFWSSTTKFFLSLARSWTKALSSLHYSREELQLHDHLKQNGHKFLMFLGFCVVIYAILYFEEAYEANRNFVVVSLFGMYCLGLIIHVVDRWLWKYEWAENFDIFVNKRNE